MKAIIISLVILVFAMCFYSSHYDTTNINGIKHNIPTETICIPNTEFIYQIGNENVSVAVDYTENIENETTKLIHSISSGTKHILPVPIDPIYKLPPKNDHLECDELAGCSFAELELILIHYNSLDDKYRQNFTEYDYVIDISKSAHEQGHCMGSAIIKNINGSILVYNYVIINGDIIFIDYINDELYTMAYILNYYPHHLIKYHKNGTDMFDDLSALFI